MTFREYVAQLFPNDTAIVDNWSDKDLIEGYDDLYVKWVLNNAEIEPFDKFYHTSDISDWVDEDVARKIWDFQQDKILTALDRCNDIRDGDSVLATDIKNILKG